MNWALESGICEFHHFRILTRWKQTIAVRASRHLRFRFTFISRLDHASHGHEFFVHDCARLCTFVSPCDFLCVMHFRAILRVLECLCMVVPIVETEHRVDNPYRFKRPLPQEQVMLMLIVF
jgi:hypothetical protein